MIKITYAPDCGHPFPNTNTETLQQNFTLYKLPMPNCAVRRATLFRRRD
ncbi:MAG: hypothetical protein SFV22_07790 [Saprospiraceae bacterium]|nr:hypothetical protein [Saprospiraceae bacterium]